MYRWTFGSPLANACTTYLSFLVAISGHFTTGLSSLKLTGNNPDNKKWPIWTLWRHPIFTFTYVQMDLWIASGQCMHNLFILFSGHLRTFHNRFILFEVNREQSWQQKVTHLDPMTSSNSHFHISTLYRLTLGHLRPISDNIVYPFLQYIKWRRRRRTIVAMGKYCLPTVLNRNLCLTMLIP